MKKIGFKLLSFLVMAAICVGFAACGDDDDDDNGDGGAALDVTKLIGKTFLQKDESYGVNVGATKYTEVEFLNERIAVVRVYGRDLGDYGYESYDNGYVKCSYTISSNVISIAYKESIVMTCKNNAPVGWTLINDKGYSGPTTEWLEPGYYYCREVSVFKECDDCRFAGDKQGFIQLINDGDDGPSVIGVVEGNQLGVMFSRVSFNRPTDKDAIIIASETFFAKTVYLYIYPGLYLVGISDWSKWKDHATYSDKTLTSNGYVYKKVK